MRRISQFIRKPITETRLRQRRRSRKHVKLRRRTPLDRAENCGGNFTGLSFLVGRNFGAMSAPSTKWGQPGSWETAAPGRRQWRRREAKAKMCNQAAACLGLPVSVERRFLMVHLLPRIEENVCLTRSGRFIWWNSSQVWFTATRQMVLLMGFLWVFFVRWCY